MISEALGDFFEGDAFFVGAFGAVEFLPTDLVFFAAVRGLDAAMALLFFAAVLALVLADFFDLSTGLALPAMPGRFEDLAAALLALVVTRFFGGAALAGVLAPREAGAFFCLEVEPDFFVARTIVLLRHRTLSVTDGA